MYLCTQMSKKGKVLVAMSGGIDSTVTAIMLREEGYEVVGITMKTWDYESSKVNGKETGCCSLDSINDARAIAVKHGIHHFILDIREEFGNFVIDNFIDEYLAGRTPNPCVLCNTHIKWEALLKRADMLDCEFIATGHYAKRNYNPDHNRYYVSRGKDLNKDQSYVLWGLAQKNLARTLFPMGQFHKPEIKQMAVDMGYMDLAKKSESYEICFVPDNDYRQFLKNQVEGLEKRVDGGNFVSTDGKILGQHKGYPFYTIGQRKGLEIALGEPMFVVSIQPQTNTVVLGRKEELASSTMWVRNVNMQKYDFIAPETEALTKIRYKDPGAMAVLNPVGDKVKATFHIPVSAIAPGQSAVFYEGEDVIGGGWIDRNDANQG